MNKKHIMNLVVILAVCLTAYANSFGNEFVYDDQHIIEKLKSLDKNS